MVKMTRNEIKEILDKSNVNALDELKILTYIDDILEDDNANLSRASEYAKKIIQYENKINNIGEDLKTSLNKIKDYADSLICCDDIQHNSAFVDFIKQEIEKIEKGYIYNEK